MASPVQEIKDRLDIVEFIRSYIALLPAGKNFKALCPFHKEKTPSFMVSPERQTWHCFGACAEGGDIFRFLMKHDNLEFYEALKVLAEKAGVELKRISPADQKQFGVLYDINESAKEFFKRELEKSAEALKYLTERGLKKEIIEEFELGLAPNVFDELTLYLINLNYQIKDVERAGLIFKTEKGSYIDRFRGRVMFPVYNHFGKVAGFSGRILPEFDTGETGKYINSPETPIFNKSRILYGFHKTKKEILKQKSAVLVEGQMDFLLVWQDGIKNVAATSGTALTADHLKTLKRLTDQLIFLFDNDEAGLKAAERSIDLAENLDFNVKLPVFKDFKDPAEAVQKSPGLLANLLKDAKPAMEFYFERYLSEEIQNSKIPEAEQVRYGAGKIQNLGELKKNIRIVLGKIKNLASAVERTYWIKELSLRVGIEERALMEEMEQLKTRTNYGSIINADLRANQRNRVGEKSALSRRELIAQRLMSLIMADEYLKTEIKDYLEYLPDDYRKIYAGEAGEQLDNLINLLSLRSSFETQNIDKEKITEEFRELLRQLKSEYYKERKQSLAKLIREAEKSGDEKKLSEILQEFDRASKLAHN